eukprot:8613101-Prorocentrum_lima.AAC.1
MCIRDRYRTLWMWRRQPCRGDVGARQRIFGPAWRNGAAPGPSGARNALVRALAQTTHGLDVLVQVADMVAGGKWSQEDHMLWYAATLEPAWA